MATNRTTSTVAARRFVCAAAAVSAVAIALAAVWSAPAPAAVRSGNDFDSRCGGVAPVTSSSLVAARSSAPRGSRPYGWPLKPFDRQHAIRAYFNDPREAANQSHSFHFGVDISARDGTPVYAVEAGTAYLSSARAVAVREPSGRVLAYWHIVPVVSDRQGVAKHQLLGHVERGWGHVHFAESLRGDYVNPLRAGALTPYLDRTVPTVAGLRVERSQLVVDAFDTVPVVVPRPWNDMPVTPVLLRWRVVAASGAELVGWRTAIDFRHGRLAASRFRQVYARDTRKNAPSRPGRYCFRVGGWKKTRLAGDYSVQIAAYDTAGNRTIATFPGSEPY